MESLYKKTLDLISELFRINLAIEKNSDIFFQGVKSVINFDESYVFLLSPEEIKFETSYNPKKKFKAGMSTNISPELSKKLFLTEDLSNDDLKEVLEALNFDLKKNYILTKLKLKDTIFGFIVYARTGAGFYKEELYSLNTVANVFAYKLKDLELSKLFQNQLMALKVAMSESNQAYQLMQAQNKKILAADKIKNEFLANVSHELRTPLNAIIGFSEILQTQTYGKLNEQQAEYINDIQTSGINLLGMINEVLDMSKIDANAIKLVKRTFEISRVVTEVLNILQPIYKKKQINVGYSIQEDIDFYADYQKIQQILYNLLSNAIKFTPENGFILIDVKNTKKNLVIRVKDSGIGIEKKNHKKIFAKFVQLKDAFTRKESSTGLGLAIVKELVELHQGKIKVESELGKGASFIITLPRLSEPQE